mgnify:CR=1 FL=1
MSRKVIIDQLKKKNPKVSKTQLEEILDIFCHNIKKALSDGKSFEIRDFGKFETKTLKENFNARNPSTNEIIYVPKRIKVKFKASKNLKKIINS